LNNARGLNQILQSNNQLNNVNGLTKTYDKKRRKIYGYAQNILTKDEQRFEQLLLIDQFMSSFKMEDH